MVNIKYGILVFIIESKGVLAFKKITLTTAVFEAGEEGSKLNTKIIHFVEMSKKDSDLNSKKIHIFNLLGNAGWDYISGTSNNLQDYILEQHFFKKITKI